MQEDLLVVCRVLRYFVCSSWCGVEVRVNGCGSEGGVLGVPPPVCGLGVGGVVLTFLRVCALLSLQVTIAVFPLGVVSIVVTTT